MSDLEGGRPPQPPRLPADRRPIIPKEGLISEDPELMPESLQYDAGTQRLAVGQGYIKNVTPAMWAYEISGKQVLLQWFSYRKKNRERPMIGDRRAPSKLGEIQGDHWLPEYTTELLNVLNVLGMLIDLQPAQDSLLNQVCDGPLISEQTLRDAGALDNVPKAKKSLKVAKPIHPQLF